MQDELFELILAGDQKQEMLRIMSCNEKTQAFGLSLTMEDTQVLLRNRKNTLKEQRRVEFGEGILPKLIEEFCDSQYINQDEYTAILTDLQEIFYLYKNESMDQLTDDELLTFMREQFDGVCFGSVEYLSGTCLERFGRAIREGYRDYRRSGGKNEYGTGKLAEEMRWDKELFYEVWSELIS